MDTPKPNAPIISAYAIDDVALAAMRLRGEHDESEPRRCDLCGEPIVGPPAGSGLLLWARGDELRWDEPPLCPCCAATISVTAFADWDDGGGDEG
jgi:hypothetical protein